MFLEIIKFIIYSALIVLISKYILVTTLRKLAESLKLKPKTVGNIAGYATSIPELLTITTSSLRGLSGASVYNIISSNVINFIQYIGAILLNEEENICIMLNEEDHLRIQVFASGLDLEHLLDLAIEIDCAINGLTNYAYNEKYVSIFSFMYGWLVAGLWRWR